MVQKILIVAAVTLICQNEETWLRRITNAPHQQTSKRLRDVTLPSFFPNRVFADLVNDAPRLADKAPFGLSKKSRQVPRKRWPDSEEVSA
jgi:hypothetical protein